MDGHLKVASVQFHVVDGDMAANMAKVEEMAMKVSDNEKNVDLMLFHEACLESGIGIENIDDEITEKVNAFWKVLAAKTGINILAGRLERQGEKIYNKATVYAPDGKILADYAKIHLYNQEREVITPGDQLSIFELNGMKIGIMICADFGFPELSRKYATAGVDVLAVTSSWAYPDDDLWDICNRARSAENGIYVVSCDRTGPTSKGVVKVGRSMVCDPNGFVIANLVEKEDIYFVETLHKSEVDERHKTMKWLEWLRPEVYAKL